MLKALELVGFKSFADRTRFDFPDGITVVVGPNGSGKSNVVDAIKWVLGAQSAKSLRGSEMTDVIFKGSAEGGRKPANSAEVVLILDNRRRQLAIELDEVHVTRRVYRNGEGEYAINSQPCRLKDVRDLFRGSGVGVDSYSLIEQGKVDRLLQSSARDRRAIFEEAAGVSRFKAKKAEAERRLLRVDQNMLRIRDIVDELGKRLATLKTQASKAQRYREWTQQIVVKRTQIGLLDAHELDDRLQATGLQIASAESSRNELRSLADALNDELRDRSAQLGNVQEQQNELGRRLASLQREHVQATSERISIQSRQLEWDGERTNLLERVELLERRVTIGEEEIQERQRELDRLEEVRQTAQVEVDHCESQVREQEGAYASAKRDLENCRTEQEQQREILAGIKADASSHAKELEQAISAMGRIELELTSKANHLAELQTERQRSLQELESAKSDYESADERKKIAKRLHQDVSERQRSHQHIHMELQARIQGIQERLSFLSQLEEQFSNAGRGGQQLIRSAHTLAKAMGSLESGIPTIRGLVADLIATDLHLAPLVDVALGTHADAIVLTDGQLVDWINEGRLIPEGRVTLLRLDRLTTRRAGEKIQLDGLRGVVGRADRLVRFDALHEPLVRALLGTTWFVENLATALDLSHFRGAGLRFVTAECQLVDTDGSITLGSLQTGLGLVSRRSEMQAAAEQGESHRVALHQAKDALETIERELQIVIDSEREAEDCVVDAARRVAAAEQRMRTIEQQAQLEKDGMDARRLELTEKTNLRATLQRAMAEFDVQRLELEDADARRSFEIEQMLVEIQLRETVWRDSQHQLVERRIEIARLEQRLEGMRVTLEQLLHDASERTTHLQIARDGLNQLMLRIAASELSLQQLEQRILITERDLERNEQLRLELVAESERLQRCVSESNSNRDSLQRQIDKLLDRIGSMQEERMRIEAQRDEMIARYRNDYQIDLTHPESRAIAHREDQSPVHEWNRIEIENQLATLRQDIAAAGSVNMEALDELDELQLRFNRLSGQENDLLEAKSGLMKTMEKIDSDSQTLFRETLEAIRTNFQALYRKSFGGGSADIVLENPDDPESGVEILATPPGKTSFNNSLLSGGEKALTAVALIMAFFQYRPSPFCILDEVDAPFDEANIGRFVTVMNEFLDSTKFIVVTHSKKTMTVANMIYGVTMQESGVSRQVAVKFEEVNDHGEIIRRAA